MNLRSIVTVPAVALVLVACGPQDSAPNAAGTWVGTITTEGNVTTVVNESGSVWGGTATLVEEASVGVESGADEYMFGEIGAVRVLDGEIYVVERSAAAVRVYDLSGAHLRSFGRRGQGPGELGRFVFDVAMGPEGRIYVGDFDNRRINIYSRAGEPIDEIPLPGRVACCRVPLVFADGGGVWLHVRVAGEDGQASRDAIRVHDADGPVGEALFVPEIEYDRRVFRLGVRDVERVPFAASLIWTFAHDRRVVVGASDKYAFRMIRPGGETTIVERFWDPIPVTDEEADYWRRLTLASFPPGTESSWNGENIPEHKPAFLSMIPAASGETWVLRQGPVAVDGCAVEPEVMAETSDPILIQKCLLGELIIDVFGRDGRYLGEVDGLPFMFAPPFIDGDTVIATAQDEAGTIMVKRYRLMLPGEGDR
ncbi:MAG: 6-bladed beta-propeller [Acidobacteria bacterium]|nr:6-bladed beta-propeller [Acidobacteriota bacterium]